jgi:hypothetical protein
MYDCIRNLKLDYSLRENGPIYVFELSDLRCWNRPISDFFGFWGGT